MLTFDVEPSTAIPTATPTTEFIYNDRYVYVSNPMNWSAANTYCGDQFGTTLATITSDEDAVSVLNLTQSVAVETGAWIGLNDIENEGDFGWISGFEWSLNVFLLSLLEFIAFSLF